MKGKPSTLIQETNFEESLESIPCSFQPRPTAAYRWMQGGGNNRLLPDPLFSSCKHRNQNDNLLIRNLTKTTIFV